VQGSGKATLQVDRDCGVIVMELGLDALDDTHEGSEK
jgi:hypothetical protein